MKPQNVHTIRSTSLAGKVDEVWFRSFHIGLADIGWINLQTRTTQSNTQNLAKGLKRNSKYIPPLNKAIPYNKM